MVKRWQESRRKRTHCIIKMPRRTEVEVLNGWWTDGVDAMGSEERRRKGTKEERKG